MKDWTGNDKATFSTIGASNHSSKEREVDDYYATDPIAIDALERSMYDKIPLGVWECACGGGHISERLKQMGFNVVSSDKVNRGYGDVVDFLAAKTMPTKCECIITNPPYKYALEFVKHALELLHDGERCFFFLKTTFLEGQRRYDELFKATPPGIRLAVLQEGALREERGFRKQPQGGERCRLRMVRMEERLLW